MKEDDEELYAWVKQKVEEDEEDEADEDDDELYTYRVNQNVMVYWKNKTKNWWKAKITDRRLLPGKGPPGIQEYRVEFKVDASFDWVKESRVRLEKSSVERVV